MKSAQIRLVLAATTALFSIAPAYAQNDDAGAGDIVVTARRTEERLQDVPISITVFTPQQLANRNVVSGADLATYTPSLAANGRYGAETASFSIRGFTQESYTSPSVAVYFADVIGPRAQGGTPGGNGAGVGQFFDLQNIQVLKGPQGTLFGRNTTGGAVLLVPQKPKGELGGYLEGSYGNYDMYRVQGVLNVPLSETFKVRLGFERQKRDGYVRNRTDIGPRDFGDVDYWAARLGILAEITPTLENYTLVRYSKSDTNGLIGRVAVANAPGCRDGVSSSFPAPTANTTPYFLAPLACSQYLARAREQNYGYWDVENGNADPYLKVAQWGITNTTTWQAGDTITFKNIASYQEFRQDQAFNIGSDNYVVPALTQTGTPNPYAGTPFTWVGLAKDPKYHNVEQYTATEELQIQGHTSNGALTYVVGGYFETSGPLSQWQGSYSSSAYVRGGTYSALPCTDIANLQCSPVNGLGVNNIPGVLQNSLTRYQFRNIGFFAQSTFNFTDHLSATGGFRYTIDKVTGQGGTRQLFFTAPNVYTATCAANSSILAPTGESCVRTITQKSQKPTWLVDLDYKPTNDILIYAKYSRGYRQGNINASNTVPNAWGPEKVDAYEIGTKTSFRGTVSGFLNVAAFYNDFSNQQLVALLVPLPGTTNIGASAIVNAGKSRIQGVEVDGAIGAGGANLLIGYAYLDTVLKSYSPPDYPGYLPPTTNSVIGGVLPQSPRHRITLTPSYVLPFDSSVGKVTIAATFTYTAKQVATNDSPIGILPATSLWNLNLNWNKVAGSPIDFSAFVTNLTNEKYPVFVGNSWGSTGTDSLILGQPRMYGIRLRYSFGSER